MYSINEVIASFDQKGQPYQKFIVEVDGKKYRHVLTVNQDVYYEQPFTGAFLKGNLADNPHIQIPQGSEKIAYSVYTNLGGQVRAVDAVIYRDVD